jgi:hypothetical protein
MPLQVIPLKARTDLHPAEFWPRRLFAFELRHQGGAAPGSNWLLLPGKSRYSEVWRKNPAPSPGISLTSATTAWRPIPEHAGHPVRDTRSDARLRPQLETEPNTSREFRRHSSIWEALPATASHQGAFDFPDASRSLFEVVAGMTDLLPLVRAAQEIKASRAQRPHCVAGHVASCAQ